MDGGSNDGTIEIIKKYEKWLTYWKSEPDGGQAQAINMGFRISTGEIVAWINSDDYYGKSIFALISTCMKEKPEYDFFYGDLLTVDGTDKMKGKYSPGEFNFARALYGNIIPQPACFWRSSVFNDMGYLSEKYHYLMDYEFWMRCGIKKKFKYIPEVFAHFREHAASKGLSQSLSFRIEDLVLFSDFFRDYAEYSESISAQKNKVLCLKNERLAIAYYKNQSMSEARKYFKRVLCLTPFRIQSVTMIFYILDTLLDTRIAPRWQEQNRKIREYLHNCLNKEWRR
jgi:glycosyltransferase involved in cell wall biosynthesis